MWIWFGRMLFALVVLVASGGAVTADPTTPFRFGTTAVILQDQAGFLARWGRYLAQRLDRPVRSI